MLDIKKRKLSGTLQLQSVDTTLVLRCDEECVPIGVVSFQSGARRFVQFVRDGDRFLGRFVVRKRDIPEIATALFHVMMCGVASDQSTNKIPIDANVEVIKRETTSQEVDEIYDMKAQIEAIRLSVDKLSKGLAIPKLDLNGPGITEPGMVPIAVDSHGTFVAGHPFFDCVHSVNGKKCVDGSIVIDASMIEYAQGKTVAQYLAALAGAIDGVNGVVQAIRERVSDLADQVNELELRVSARLDGGAM